MDRSLLDVTSDGAGVGAGPEAYRVSVGLGSEASLPDFSQPLSPATFLTVHSPSTILPQASALTFRLPSPSCCHLLITQVSAQMSPLRQRFPAQPVHNDPHPQRYLTTPCGFLHSTPLSEMFFNLCIVGFPNQNTSPRSAGTLPLCLSLLALSSEVEQCWPQNCLGKESQGHPSWFSSPASSSRPFST